MMTALMPTTTAMMTAWLNDYMDKDDGGGVENDIKQWR